MPDLNSDTTTGDQQKNSCFDTVSYQAERRVTIPKRVSAGLRGNRWRMFEYLCDQQKNRYSTGTLPFSEQERELSSPWSKRILSILRSSRLESVLRLIPLFRPDLSFPSALRQPTFGSRDSRWGEPSLTVKQRTFDLFIYVVHSV